jgi:hypothetical protein
MLSNSRFQGQSVRLVSGIQLLRNERGILISRAKVGLFIPTCRCLQHRSSIRPQGSVLHKGPYVP